MNISAAPGLQSFSPSSMFRTLESMIYGVVANVAAPLIHRSFILAAIYKCQQSVLKAYNGLGERLIRVG